MTANQGAVTDFAKGCVTGKQCATVCPGHSLSTNYTQANPTNRGTNKQLLDDEVEHDIVNYQNRGLCYLPFGFGR